MPCANRTTNTDTSYVRCPVLTNHFGKSTARVLQQLHYWLSYENLSYGIIHDNSQWIRNSYNQWHQQIKKTNQDLAIITIRRAFSELEKQGVVLSHCFEDHKNYMGGNQVKSYTIDYDRLESIVGDFNKTLISRPRSVKEQQSTSNTQTHNRAGDTSSLSIVSVHMNAYNVCQKRASNPDQMSTPPDQMSTPLNRYISNKHSNKLSHFRTPRSIEHTQQRFGDAETIQPGKPAERDEIDFSKEMIGFWNEIVEENNPQRKISLNPKRTQQLNAAFKQFFESDISKWELFCHKITTCKFLMGEITRFKAPIDWTISFETIQKIQEGGYTFGTRESNYTLKLSTDIRGAGDKTLKAPSVSFIPSLHESPKACLIRDAIKKTIDNAQYVSWFLPTEIIVEKNENGNDEAIICVQNRFMGERIKTHYRDIYERYFDHIFVGSAKQYFKSNFFNNSINSSQTLDIVNDYNELKIENPIKNICVVNVYDEHEVSELYSSEKNIHIDITANVDDEKNSYIQNETFSNSSSGEVDLGKVETTSYIVEHKENNPFRKKSCEQCDTNNVLLKTTACVDVTHLFNDERTDQQEINQASTHDLFDMEHISSCNNINGEEPNSDLIKGHIEDSREKSVDFSHISSAQISVKTYSSALDDLKIIQIRKKIKKLIPDYLYMKWFQNATIFIEEGRAFLHVPTHSIKQDIEAKSKDIIYTIFEEIHVVGGESQCDASSVGQEEPSTNEQIIESLEMTMSSNANKRDDLSRQPNIGLGYQGGINVHYRYKEPPDKFYVCQRISDSAFDQLRALINDVCSFDEKSRCRDPVRGVLNDEIRTHKTNTVYNMEYLDTSMLKPRLVNDNDPPDIKREAVFANTEPFLMRFLGTSFRSGRERIIKPTTRIDLQRVSEERHHRRKTLFLLKEHGAYRIRDGTHSCYPLLIYDATWPIIFHEKNKVT